ncbi:MAG: restriction endonuclease [Candidatus Pacebacteria bacterium]|nr:restriction endonuclease [Candidatus Paceibacterota bacterium]MCD8508249.1 restriction endonuclease [Candidatus Paceibacterota bacterium]MCD8527724.1 restriction endonuclease [Candidatus Paceibacterota bacterium]MCD8563475.1 restriction endonuclease [Candidatus Paceibacterota bacterium]
MEIRKKSGEKEVYDPQKLCRSIEAAGADPQLAAQICIDVGEHLAPGATTTKIFRETIRRLLRSDMDTLARYSLRRSVDNLGPTGFLFEQYIEALLQAHGYTTKRNITMQGRCTDHEVDVYAEKDGMHFIIEAKYHNDHNIKTSIDKVMYADARFMDIERRMIQAGDEGDYKAWVITNTKFTDKSIEYAECRGLQLLGWNYPKDNNLEMMIVKKNMYPITILPSLTQFARDQFTAHNMILAQDILPYTPDQLEEHFDLTPALAKKILKEAQQLLN